MVVDMGEDVEVVATVVEVVSTVVEVAGTVVEEVSTVIEVVTLAVVVSGPSAVQAVNPRPRAAAMASTDPRTRPFFMDSLLRSILCHHYGQNGRGPQVRRWQSHDPQVKLERALPGPDTTQRETG